MEILKSELKQATQNLKSIFHKYIRSILEYASIVRRIRNKSLEKLQYKAAGVVMDVTQGLTLGLTQSVSVERSLNQIGWVINFDYMYHAKINT